MDILKIAIYHPIIQLLADKNGDPLAVEIVFINKKFLSKKDFKKNAIPKYLPNNPLQKKNNHKFSKRLMELAPVALFAYNRPEALV